MRLIREHAFHLLLRHPESVVGNLHIKILPVPVHPDPDLPITVHKLHSVIDRILHERLEDQLHARELHDILIRLDLISKTVLKPHVLDHQIVSHMFQLIPNGNNALPTA